MSERIYEDGTPATYEPKVKGWMRRAGLDIACLDLDGEFHRLMREQALRPEQVPPRLMNLLASIIAEHAPKPESQPIRQGDVVQVILTKSCRVVVCDTPADGQPGEFRLSNGQLYSPRDVVRIGRARYYPDGTEVEG